MWIPYIIIYYSINYVLCIVNYTPILVYPKKAKKNGAGEGNRTLATSLEGWGSTIELHPQKKMVGAAGFEPATPGPQARCATKLRYAPSLITLLL